MTPLHIAQSVAAVPFFATRAFQTGFVAALVIRLSQETEWFWLAGLRGLPGWYSSNLVLLSLGVLAVLELVAAKNPDARRVLGVVDKELKAVAQAVFTVALVSGLGTLEPEPAAVQPLQAGFFDLTWLWSVSLGAAVWWLARVRERIFNFFIQLDEDDEFGVQRLISWAEDGLVGFGMLLVLLLPALALVLAGLMLLGLWLVQRWLRAREAKQRVPCAQCGEPNHASALECARCRQSIAAPRVVGVFGQAGRAPVVDRELHRHLLAARKRCPSCAQHLEKKAIQQRCPACGTVTFADAAALDAHLARLHEKLPHTLAICAGCGLVPLFGLIPGILYYRLSLLGGLRGYVPPVTGMVARWLVRILHVLLVMLQPVPILGVVVLPLMCFSNYHLYRKLVRREAARKLTATPG